MKPLITRFVREDEGQDLIEYAVVGGLIAVAGITLLTSIGTQVTRVLGAIVTKLTNITVN